jgi:hypothetical protein
MRLVAHTDHVRVVDGPWLVLIKEESGRCVRCYRVLEHVELLDFAGLLLPEEHVRGQWGPASHLKLRGRWQTIRSV